MRRLVRNIPLSILAFGLVLLIITQPSSRAQSKELKVVASSVSRKPEYAPTPETDAENEGVSEEKPLYPKEQIQVWLHGETINEEWHKFWTEYPNGDGPPYPEDGHLQLLDLNDDGKDELLIFQGCIVSGNCGLDIYLAKQDKANKILSTGQTQSVKKLESSTRGFDDLELRTWNSGYEYYLRVMKYNGKKYTESKCWFETNVVNDKMLDKPVITPIKCGQYGYVK